MSPSSAEMPMITVSSGTHSVQDTTGRDPAAFASAVSLRSSASAATLIDPGLTWKKTMSSVLGGRTIHAAAQIPRNHVDNRHNIVCTITVVGKTTDQNACFKFGTRDGTPYAEYGSTSEGRELPIPHGAETGAPHSKAIIALIKAVEKPTDDLLKLLVKGWPKKKDEFVDLLLKIDDKIKGGLEHPEHARVWGWFPTEDTDVPALQP